MKNGLALRPTYWASVSGGKDSLFMLQYILSHLDEYPLDGVVHFELEIDFPFIKDVTKKMEEACKEIGVPFVRIKPRKTWEELYYTINKPVFERTGEEFIWGFPTRIARWCNSRYKLDAKKQLEEFMRARGKYVVHYIGYCFDEEKRWSKKTDCKTEVYPLVEHQILEDDIWQWAKNQEIFNHYYETNRRCGCMYCPMSGKMELAYLYKYYPENFEYMIAKVRETEQMLERQLGIPHAVLSGNPKYNADYMEQIIKTKWLNKLNELEKQVQAEKDQITLFEYLNIEDE